MSTWRHFVKGVFKTPSIVNQFRKVSAVVQQDVNVLNPLNCGGFITLLNEDISICNVYRATWGCIMKNMCISAISSILNDMSQRCADTEDFLFFHMNKCCEAWSSTGHCCRSALT